jgi:hypothetical protein
MTILCPITDAINKIVSLLVLQPRQVYHRNEMRVDSGLAESPFEAFHVPRNEGHSQVLCIN